MTKALAAITAALLITMATPADAKRHRIQNVYEPTSQHDLYRSFGTHHEPVVKQKRTYKKYAKKKKQRTHKVYVHRGRKVPTTAAPAPSAFIRGSLICAANINAALAAKGIRGTGSRLAKSFLSWGRPSGPVPGAVAIFHRGRKGGHVAFVDHVRPDGTVIYLNPSSRRQRWEVGPYGRKPIAFRVASI